MFRYCLRTLLLLTILAPPALAAAWWAARSEAFIDEIGIVAAAIWGLALISAPFFLLSYVATCVAAARKKR